MTPPPADPAPTAREDITAADDVLARATGGEPELLLTLTDEQIAGLDGEERRQFVAEPWLESRSEVRAEVAEAGLRALLAAERVRELVDPTTGRRRWQAEPEIVGCLLLRRTAPTFTTAERTVQTPHGPEVQRLHHYVHPGGVLEEEVTPSGLHRFTPLRPEQAAARLAVVVDREGAAEVPAGGPSGDGGAADGGAADGGAADGDRGAEERSGTARKETVRTESVRVRGSELAAGHPLAARLAAAQALVVLTSVRADDGAVRQVSVATCEDEVLLMEAEDPAAADPPLRIRSLDSGDVRALAVEILGV
ncbi:hypothetical protein [Brachybacterium aquaticum]|uniref:Uncharacterized protein n=1 Tax=Brachybacterium aquaticum TaxID=1432564 RepID=A0A841AGT5_9MICO|nr:hypothetical protein [Brachybacterium aquaticum]MBB5833213.1 hypothetical protein [Brachybacterium aquaticum]